MRYVVTGLLVVCGLLAYQQAARWSSELDVWQQAQTVAPDKPRVLINLGRALELDQRPAEAALAYQGALEATTDPRRPHADVREARAVARTNLARLAGRGGEPYAGIALLDVALGEFPDFAPAVAQRAILTAAVGLCQASRDDVDAVKRITGHRMVVPCEPR